MLRYDFNVFGDGSPSTNAYLDAQVTGVQVNPPSKSLPTGKLAGHAFLAQGSELIIGPGLDSILPLAKRRYTGPLPFVPWARAAPAATIPARTWMFPAFPC